MRTRKSPIRVSLSLPLPVLAGALAVVIALAGPRLGSATVFAQSQDPAPSATIVMRLSTLVPQQTGVPAQATATPSAVAPTAIPTAVAPTATLAVAAPTATITVAAAAVTSPAAAPTSTQAVADRDQRPILVVKDFDMDPDRPAPGDSFRLKLKVVNVGRDLAQNIQLGLSGDTFLSAGSGPMLYDSRLAEDEDETFKAELRVAAGAAPGVHPLTVSLRWDDELGGSFSDATTIGIEVGGTTGRPVVIVTAARLPGRVAPGVPFTLALDLQNTGGREAHNVVAVPSMGPLALHGGGVDGTLVLPPGGTATLALRVIAASLADPGATTQTLELRYDDSDGQRYTDTQSVGLVVTGEAALGPILIVDSYSVDPAELHPGAVFELQLELVNAGVGEATQTRLVLGGGSGGAGGAAVGSGSLGVFAPLETSNVRFVGRLAAGGSRTVIQKMVVDGGAKPGVYTLDVGLSYVDSDGQAQQGSQVVTLLVSRAVNIVIRPLDVITSTIVGQPFDFSLEVINKGSNEVNVTNFEVQPGRFMSVRDGSLFVGPLDGGGLDVLDAVLTPKAPSGDAQVKVVVTYRDDFNREQTLERSFSFVIEAAPEGPPEPVDLEPVGGGAGDGALRILKGLLGLGASPRRAGPSAVNIGGPAQSGRTPGDSGDSFEPSPTTSDSGEPSQPAPTPTEAP